MEEVTKLRSSKKSSFPKRKVNSAYSLKKRPLWKKFNQENTVYVTNKTDIKTLIQKCENYLNKNINEFSIYCVGAAIERGLNLALQISEKYPSTSLSVNTSTICITDDLEPLTDDLDYATQKRENSMVHIRVLRENAADILNCGQD